MPTHKMQTIDGIRYRPEDVGRARARAGAGAPAGPLTAAHAAPPHPGFDPAASTIPAVLEYLASADEEETARVLDSEAAGEKRASLLKQREQLLGQARERADHGPAA